jgi:hypothetical protein
VETYRRFVDERIGLVLLQFETDPGEDRSVEAEGDAEFGQCVFLLRLIYYATEMPGRRALVF